MQMVHFMTQYTGVTKAFFTFKIGYMRKSNFIRDHKESTTFPAAIFNETQQLLNNIMYRSLTLNLTQVP